MELGVPAEQDGAGSGEAANARWKADAAEAEDEAATAAQRAADVAQAAAQAADARARAASDDVEDMLADLKRKMGL